jgi:hypothetical protein
VYTSSPRRRGRRIAGFAAAAAIVASLSVVSSGSAKNVSRQRQLEAAAARVTKAPPAILPASGKALGGFTSQQMPVVLQITKQDKRIGIAATTLEMNCTSGDQPLLPDNWIKLPLSKKGAVNATVQLPPSAPAAGDTVGIAGGSDTFSGKLNAKKATFSGTWDLHIDFSMPNNQTDSCDSGRVTFRAVL